MSGVMYAPERGMDSDGDGEEERRGLGRRRKACHMRGWLCCRRRSQGVPVGGETGGNGGNRYAPGGRGRP